VTYQRFKTAWRGLRAESGVTDFPVHDFRHNIGSKVSRQIKSLRLLRGR
jgi:hypothetical protein